MILPLLFVLAAPPGPAAPPREDFRVTIAAGKIRNLPIHIPAAPVRLDGRFLVEEGPGSVRLVLLRAGQAELFRHGAPHTAEAATAYGRDEYLSRWIIEPGDYELILDNRLEGRGLTTVVLAVEYAPGVPASQVRYPDPDRARALRLTGVLVFLLAGAPSGWAIRRAIRLRRIPQPPPPSA